MLNKDHNNPIEDKVITNTPIEDKVISNMPIENMPIENMPIENMPIDDNPISIEDAESEIKSCSVRRKLFIVNQVVANFMKNNENITIGHLRNLAFQLGVDIRSVTNSFRRLGGSFASINIVSDIDRKKIKEILTLYPNQYTYKMLASKVMKDKYTIHQIIGIVISYKLKGFIKPSKSSYLRSNQTIEIEHYLVNTLLDYRQIAEKVGASNILSVIATEKHLLAKGIISNKRKPLPPIKRKRSKKNKLVASVA